MTAGEDIMELGIEEDIWKTMCTPVQSLHRLGYDLDDRRIGARFPTESVSFQHNLLHEGHLESKERFAIQRYLLIIGKKQNMQVLSHTFTYFST